jgi:hAT family C-terminal dimerisation region
LSKNSATLLTAEGVYKFLFEKLDEFGTDLSKNLSKQIKKRMDERRDKILMTLIIFLESGNIPRSNKYFDYSTKDAAIALAVEIFERIHPSAYDSTQYDDLEEVIEKITSESEDDESLNTTILNKHSLQQQLEVAISSITHVEEQNEASTTLLKKDFLLLSNSKTRTDNLNILFNELLTIKPTSTATERVFSIAGLTKTKIRTRLNFETFNPIIFLKYAFL